MKQKLLVSSVVAAMLVITGCSSTNRASNTSSSESISEQRLAVSDFKRQGVKIGYTLGGEVDFIETTGYAPVWGSSQNAAREAFRVAELEAKKSLNDFINKESITSSVSVRMISQNLENARDSKKNMFSTSRSGTDELVALDVEPGAQPTATQETTREETAQVRADAMRLATRVNTTITTQNRGILGGLYLVEGRVINDGKNVQVVYRWDRKSNAQRQQLRTLMSQ